MSFLLQHAFCLYKALLFDDEQAAHLISAANTADEAKKLGRSVKGFLQPVWDEHKAQVMEYVLTHKFHDARLSSLLQGTCPRELLEASPGVQPFGDTTLIASMAGEATSWGSSKQSLMWLGESPMLG